MIKIRRLLSLIILALFAGWLTWYILKHPDKFSVISNVSVTSVALLVIIFAGIMICNGYFTRDIMSAFDVHLPPREWISLAFMSGLLNSILPFRGGAGFRATYLKAAYQFSFVNFTVTFSAMYLIICFVNGALGIAAIAMLAAMGRGFSVLLGAFLACATIASLAFICITLNARVLAHGPARILVGIVDGWKKKKKNPVVIRRSTESTSGRTINTR